MTSDALTLPLLEFLQYKAGCTYLSDLRRLDGWQRARLARVLEQIPAGAADLRPWNDALNYLAQASPANSSEGARERLITALSQVESNRNKEIEKP